MENEQIEPSPCALEMEDLAHIVFGARWHKEKHQVKLPAAHNADTPACVKLHGLLPAATGGYYA
eukprot:406092-Amphidinium_carterae.1